MYLKYWMIEFLNAYLNHSSSIIFIIFLVVQQIINENYRELKETKWIILKFFACCKYFFCNTFSENNEIL